MTVTVRDSSYILSAFCMDEDKVIAELEPIKNVTKLENIYVDFSALVAEKGGFYGFHCFSYDDLEKFIVPNSLPESLKE